MKHLLLFIVLLIFESSCKMFGQQTNPQIHEIAMDSFFL